MDWIDFHAAMPWLGPPPFWVSHADGERLRSDLGRLGFLVYETSGRAMATEDELRRDIQETMGLDDYASKNWNAFVDAFGGLVRSTLGPIALIWMDPARFFVSDLAHGVRIYGTLSSIVDEWNRLGPDCHQVVLVLEGDSKPMAS